MYHGKKANAQTIWRHDMLGAMDRELGAQCSPQFTECHNLETTQIGNPTTTQPTPAMEPGDAQGYRIESCRVQTSDMTSSEQIKASQRKRQR